MQQKCTVRVIFANGYRFAFAHEIARTKLKKLEADTNFLHNRIVAKLGAAGEVYPAKDIRLEPSSRH